MLRLVTVCRPAKAFIFYSGHPDVCTAIIIESVSIDNEYDYENEILPLTIMRMRFAQNTCSTRSGNSFHDEISSKTRSARNEFLKGKVYLL